MGSENASGEMESNQNEKRQMWMPGGALSLNPVSALLSKCVSSSEPPEEKTTWYQMLVPLTGPLPLLASTNLTRVSKCFGPSPQISADHYPSLDSAPVFPAVITAQLYLILACLYGLLRDWRNVSYFLVYILPPKILHTHTNTHKVQVVYLCPLRYKTTVILNVATKS